VSGPGPLAGVRVLDLGTRIGAPFCSGLLGEQGAEVIKVEQPGSGDFMRTIGPFVDTDGGHYSLFWSVEGRGRKGITLDLRTPEGQQLFTRLAEHADVICENFRPGTLEKWGIGPDDVDPGPERRRVWVRISVFGQDGPYSQRPGLDRLGIGYGGLLHLTGYPDRPPVRPGVTVSDYLTGVFAAQAATSLLYARRGGVVDAPLYGSVLRILEWTIAGQDRLGVTRTREGNRLKNSAPLDNYPTKDGKWVCVVAGSDANFERLCHAMDRTDLLTDPRWDTLAKRASRSDEINGIVAEWTSTLTAAEVEARCVEHDVPVGTAYTARDIVDDPHMRQRHDVVAVDDPVIGPTKQQAPYPRIDGAAPRPPAGAPTLGQHNDEVWCDLVGLTPDELAGYRAKKVI
jgi:crotonobetainyl-CoA:carnitine CoA-transferase CaiB-like acyl-CoA transferase